MNPWPYEHYLFDLYGTLADIRTDEEDPRLWSSFAWYLRLQGMDWAPRALQAAYKAACEENLAQKTALLAARGIPGPAEADIRQVFAALARMRGAALSPEQTEGIACLFRALCSQKLRLFDGAAAVLSALRKDGRKVTLLTNAQSAFTLPELRYLGIDQAFDRILISSDAGVKKPSPAFFRLALRADGGPERAVMIGNDDQCDCWGAHGAGMDSLYLSTWQSPPRTEPLPPDCRPIPDLQAILALR